MEARQRQTIVTVEGRGLAAATEALRATLTRYPNARVVALTQQTSYISSFRGQTVLAAIVDHD